MVVMEILLLLHLQVMMIKLVISFYLTVPVCTEVLKSLCNMLL